MSPTANRQAIDAACQRIAPTWPLDRQIAVNPWWTQRQESFSEVSARHAALANVDCLMPADWYRTLYEQRKIQAAHLRIASRSLQDSDSASVQPAATFAAETPAHALITHWHNISDFIDADRPDHHRMAWRDEITHQISQFCAARFQSDKRLWSKHGLYRHWLNTLRRDRGISILMGDSALHDIFEHLPADSEELFAVALAELQVPAAVVEAYAHALLLDINGWASWVAYLHWQANLEGQSDQQMPDLLAIRLGWELALWRMSARDAAAHARLQQRWQVQLEALPDLLARHKAAQAPLLASQRAAELAYQWPLQRKLEAALAASTASQSAEEQRGPESTDTATPVLQAVFCIDVRSEPMRRALESRNPGIQTIGFAGFFGLPIEYAASNGHFSRPQLPGLLAPSITVSEVETGDTAGIEVACAEARNAGRWLDWSRGPVSAFSFVEILGLRYLGRLWTQSRPGKVKAASKTGSSVSRRWHLTKDGTPLSVQSQAELAHGILNAMGLRQFAPTVLLAGHGCETNNNPQAAALACGACGGQSGEINAQVLAQLLNDPEVRSCLEALGRPIPAATRFFAVLHNTTTEQLECREQSQLPGAVAEWLEESGRIVRRASAASRNLQPNATDAALLEDFQQLASDWSETRPEWGLANNAAFIVAPRTATRNMDLGGRVFLHDYSWEDDSGFGLLELIMTAPMIVTNWINLQYWASVTDPLKYGSGNKILHNVVGGRIGVFEGNGGDLRTGLSLQSVHDGDRWRHEPLRLSVYIRAPRAAIEDVYARHEAVRSLVDKDWLYLFRIDAEAPAEQLYRGNWVPSGSEPTAVSAAVR